MLQDFVSPVIDNEFKCNFTFVDIPHLIYIYIYKHANNFMIVP